MKKFNLQSKTLILMIVLMSSFQTLTAQEDYKRNVAKVNLTSMAFRNFQVQYERMVTPKISIALAGRIMPEGKIPLLKIAENIVDDPVSFRHLNNMEVSGTSFQPEVRFYLNKTGGPRGFYLAPYLTWSKYDLKYNDFEITLEEEYQGQTYSETKYIDVMGDISGISGGLMIGTQWNLGKFVSLDWWILGASYGSSKGNLQAEFGETLEPEWQNEVRERLEEIDIPNFDMDIRVNDTGATSKLSGPWTNLRMGLSLGIRF